MSGAEAIVVLSHPSLEVVSVPDIVRAIGAAKNVEEERFAHEMIIDHFTLPTGDQRRSIDRVGRARR